MLRKSYHAVTFFWSPFEYAPLPANSVFIISAFFGRNFPFAFVCDSAILFFLHRLRKCSSNTPPIKTVAGSLYRSLKRYSAISRKSANKWAWMTGQTHQNGKRPHSAKFMPGEHIGPPLQRNGIGRGRPVCRPAAAEKIRVVHPLK